MDHSGHSIYAQVCLGKDNCEVFTSSLLYFQEGECFSPNDFTAAAGVFEGDGFVQCSYKNLGNDEVKKLKNLAFCEVSTGVENSYQRSAWFPLLGNVTSPCPQVISL
jgi:hypothetical protein